jgi:hypothetical protein
MLERDDFFPAEITSLPKRLLTMSEEARRLELVEGSLKKGRALFLAGSGVPL